jgi:hypothetical protein
VGEGVQFCSFRMINFEGFLCKKKYIFGSCDYCVAPSPWRMCILIITMVWMLWEACVFHLVVTLKFCKEYVMGMDFFFFVYNPHLMPTMSMLRPCFPI